MSELREAFQILFLVCFGGLTRLVDLPLGERREVVEMDPGE